MPPARSLVSRAEVTIFQCRPLTIHTGQPCLCPLTVSRRPRALAPRKRVVGGWKRSGFGTWGTESLPDVRVSGRRKSEEELEEAAEDLDVPAGAPELDTTSTAPMMASQASKLSVEGDPDPDLDPGPEPGQNLDTEPGLPVWQTALRHVVNKHTALGVILVTLGLVFHGAVQTILSQLHSERVTKVLLVTAGAISGALLRYSLQASYNGLWPHGTLAANLTGCFLAGGLSPFFHIWPPGARLLLLTGFLGSLTTLSSLSLESVLLWQRQEAALAARYLLVSIGSALSACSLGTMLGGWILMR